MRDRRIAVFLDRDGTINEEVNYLSSPEQLVLIPGAADAVRALNDHGFATCVITNQSGVARGIYTEDDLVPIHLKLREELGRHRATLDRIYYCPHHPTDGIDRYRVVCRCRKPDTGMLEQGAAELGIDLAQSYVVGDRLADIQAGKAVGATTILVLTGYGKETEREARVAGIQPELIAPSIVEAVAFILTQHKGDAEEHG